MPPKLEDSIHFKGKNASTARRRYLIAFLTGNPGLIEYYRGFFTELNGLLQTDASPDVAFDFYGASIVGFEFDEKAAQERWKSLDLHHVPPFSLDEVTDSEEKDIWRTIDATAVECKDRGETLEVVVMGHSLGTFLALELLQRHRARLADPSTRARESAKITAGILLFPTIVDLAKSPKGKNASMFARIPGITSIVSGFNWGLMSVMPNFLLDNIVRRIDGRTNNLASPAVEMMKSQFGVKQAISMGLDELVQISEDKWDEEVWGALEPSPSGVPRPKLYFYYGGKDIWIDDETRAKTMKTRGRSLAKGDVEGWKPKMEIDEGGVPHDFCLAHNTPVAKKVKEYIDEIVAGHSMKS